MLLKCPECELPVSDKALTCPHCGYPMVPEKKPKMSRSKRLRLPNGFGQISEMKGHNLRNKFRAMVTVGKREDGKLIVRSLKPKAYFATYNEAYEALVEYHRNPYDLSDGLTVKEVYEKWTEKYFKELKSPSSERTIKSAWTYCSSVYNIQIRDLRARHIKGCIDEGFVVRDGETVYPSANIKSRIKSMFNLLCDYALEYELVDKNYARTFNLSNEILNDMESAKNSHISFTDKEIEILWENINKKQYADVVLIQCYSGWRPQELGLIKISDVHDGYMIGGMKTDAGKDRIVPIHPKIADLIESKIKEAMELGSEYLINCTDGTQPGMFTYDKYQKRFAKLVKELGLNPEHRAHDGRVHFVTMAKKYEMDEYAIKYIIGHKIQDLTERIYTDREIEWLKTEMQKIK